jgi:hypothetical protein
MIAVVSAPIFRGTQMASCNDWPPSTRPRQTNPLAKGHARISPEEPRIPTPEVRRKGLRGTFLSRNAEMPCGLGISCDEALPYVRL